MKKSVKRVFIGVMAISMSVFTVIGSSCGVSDWVSEKYDQFKCDHNNERIIEAVAPTCTEKGLTAGVECVDCGKILVKQEETAANGHTLQHFNKKEATCLEKGMTEGDYCTVCEEWIKERKDIKALGHNPVKTKAVAPTCEETGLTEGLACENCGEVYVAQKIIAAKGHNYVDGVCTICTEGEPFTLSVVSSKATEELSPSFTTGIYKFDGWNEEYENTSDWSMLYFNNVAWTTSRTQNGETTVTSGVDTIRFWNRNTGSAIHVELASGETSNFYGELQFDESDMVMGENGLKYVRLIAGKVYNIRFEPVQGLVFESSFVLSSEIDVEMSQMVSRVVM